MDRRAAAILALYALLAVVAVPIFPHFLSPNEFSRWLLDASVVERGTIEVTELARAFGPRFEDLAEYEGRLYSNKAPGTMLLTLPAHAAARLFSSALRPTLTAMRLAGATLPLLIFGILILRFAARYEIAAERARIVLWILLFATPLFGYGLLLFGHALVAAALFGAWLALDENRHGLAGVLLGIAVAAEYTALFPAAVLVIGVASTRAWNRLARLILAAAPFAIFVALYHYAAFGSALRNPYSYSKLRAYRELIGSGLFGLHAPSPLTAVKILFDPTYGLFVFAPVLVLGIVALAAARKTLAARSFWTLVAVPATLFIVYAGYPYWYGGWNVGPRFLVPAIPFLALPLLFRRGDWLEALLAGASSAAVTLTALVFPFVPEAFAFPWRSLALPLIADGLVAPNLVHLVDRRAAVVFPFAVVLAAMACALPPRRLVVAVAGAVSIILLVPRGSAPVVALQRSYIAEVYFERRGAMAAPPPGLVRRRDYERALPPPAWPF
jgi:hypothetical protein